MKQNLIAVAAVTAALFAGSAQAATITNNEAKPQTFKVYSGDRQQSFTLNPSDSVTIDESLCGDVCVLALQNGDEYEFALTEDLVLDEGAVYSNPPQQGGAGESGQTRQQ